MKAAGYRDENRRAVDDAHGVNTAVKTTTGRIKQSHELRELIGVPTAGGQKTTLSQCGIGLSGHEVRISTYTTIQDSTPHCGAPFPKAC